MPRRFLKLALAAAATLSLFLFVANLVLWVRSYHHLDSIGNADSINFTHHDPLYWIIYRRGQAVLCRQTGRDWDQSQLPGFHVMGIRFGGSRGAEGSMLWNLELPCWLLAATTALLPALQLEFWRRHRQRRQRQKQNRCPTCGYDLRATPHRCPECGAIPTPQL